MNFPLILKTDKKRKILKDIIVRKRLAVANFYKQNVNRNNKKQIEIDYIFCVPVNGFTSDVLQNIRFELNKYGYKIAKYTTKSFCKKLVENGISIPFDKMSQFYLGQMLVLTVSFSSQKTYREKQLQEEKCLLFLHNFFKTINYSSFCFFSKPFSFSLKNTLVVHSVAGLNIKSLYSKINNECKSIAHFSTIQNGVVYFITLLLTRIIFLLSLLNYNQLK